MEMALASAELAYNKKTHVVRNRQKIKEKSDRLNHYRSRTPRARTPKKWVTSKKEKSVSELNDENKSKLRKQQQKKRRPKSARRSVISLRGNKYKVIQHSPIVNDRNTKRIQSPLSLKKNKIITTKGKNKKTYVKNTNTHYSSASKYRHFGHNNSRLKPGEVPIQDKAKKKRKKKKKKKMIEMSADDLLIMSNNNTLHSSPSSRMKLKKKTKSNSTKRSVLTIKRKKQMENNDINDSASAPQLRMQVIVNNKSKNQKSVNELHSHQASTNEMNDSMIMHESDSEEDTELNQAIEKLEMSRQERYNSKYHLYAIKLQAAWRGYVFRKETFIDMSHGIMFLSQEICERITPFFIKIRTTTRNDNEGGGPCIETVFKHPVFSRNMICMTIYPFLNVKRVDMMSKTIDNENLVGRNSSSNSGRKKNTPRSLKLPKRNVVGKYMFVRG